MKPSADAARSGCVVFGRVSGDSAAAYVLHNASSQDKATGRVGAIAGHLLETRVRIDPGASTVNLEFSWAGQPSGSAPAPSSAPAQKHAEPAAPATSGDASKPPQASAKEEKKESAQAGSGGSAGAYTMEEVQKHNKKDDIWVIVDGQVLDVTKFLPDHPGGEKTILQTVVRRPRRDGGVQHAARPEGHPPLRA